jgi:hypothetical protein
MSSEQMFHFLQKDSLSSRSFGKFSFDSFVPNVLLLDFLSSGIETFIFPTFFLRAKRTLT